MERLTSGMLHQVFGDIIAPQARVSVPWGWSAIVYDMLQSIHALPGDIRAFIMISGIAPGDDGLLVVGVYMAGEYVSFEDQQTLSDIVKRARDRAAWTCMRDGKPGWFTNTDGPMPRILCGECQNKEAMHVA